MHHLIALLLTALPAVGPRAYAVPLSPDEAVWVEDRGSGPPVVLLPSLLCTAYGYRHVSAQLAERGYRVIVVEPLGIGRSSRPRRADWSMAAQADRVAAVLDVLGVTEALLVVHGQAAGIGLRLAYRHPERVRGVLSLDGGLVENAVTPGMRRALSLAPLIRLLGGGRVRKKVVEALRGASKDPSWLTPEVAAEYVKWTADLGGAFRVMRGMSSAREPDRVAANLGRIRCPVVLLQSTAREAPKADELAVLRERIEAFAVVPVPDSGHYIHEERPEAVLEGVERVDRESRAAFETRRQALSGGQ